MAAGMDPSCSLCQAGHEPLRACGDARVDRVARALCAIDELPWQPDINPDVEAARQYNYRQRARRVLRAVDGLSWDDGPKAAA